jgi:hypothetical protein
MGYWFLVRFVTVVALAMLITALTWRMRRLGYHWAAVLGWVAIVVVFSTEVISFIYLNPSFGIWKDAASQAQNGASWLVLIAGVGLSGPLQGIAFVIFAVGQALLPQSSRKRNKISGAPKVANSEIEGK